MSERDRYIEKAEAHLDRWAAEIDRLKAMAREAEADAKIDYHARIDELRERRDEARRQLQKMQAASDGAWNDLKAGFDRAWDDIGRAFERAASRFK